MNERTGTLAAVAASAGVSVATASKVLNGRSDVSPATRARVENVLREQNYARRAQPPAGPDRTDRWCVEVMFQGHLNAYGTEVLQGVIAAGADDGVDIVVSQHQRGSALNDAWARSVALAGRRAVIAVVEDVTTTTVRALSKAHVPLVVIDPLILPGVPITSVGSTNFAGGLSATRHLLGLGHRRIGYVGGPSTAQCNQARMQGYRAAMEEVGAPILEGYLRQGSFRYEDGVSQGGALLDLPQRPTAIFSGSDSTAAGVMEAARARGLRIPADLSVVGFDDTEMATLSAPPLTTVRQPLRKMGGVALRTALRLAANEPLDSHHVELATRLVIRESTSVAPPDA